MAPGRDPHERVRPVAQRDPARRPTACSAAICVVFFVTAPDQAITSQGVKFPTVTGHPTNSESRDSASLDFNSGAAWPWHRDFYR